VDERCRPKGKGASEISEAPFMLASFPTVTLLPCGQNILPLLAKF
jgi:hypothetical protein